MPRSKLTLRPTSNELRKSGLVVGLTDKVYPVSGSTLYIDEILVRGDLDGELEYNGSILKIQSVGVWAGMMVDERGPRGPIMQTVECRVVRK